MSHLTRYHEAFWGEDFTSSAGLDALCRHNTDQKRFLKEFEDYLRTRSKLEHEYCKGLSQLNKSMKERSELGELDTAWNWMVKEVSSSQQAHGIACGSLTQHADNVKRLCREMTVRRDTIEDKVKAFHNQKVSQFKAVQSLQKTYGHKCRDYDQLTATFQVMDREVTRTARDLDKAKAKMAKSEDEAKKADVSYKNGVQLLEDRRQDWEREMELACKEFQEKDEEQAQFLRTDMWSVMNILSQLALQVDEGCEGVLAVLEKCEVKEDIRRFIMTYSTGTQRPAPIHYQNYYDHNSTSTTSSTNDSSNTAARAFVAYCQQRASAPAASPAAAARSLAPRRQSAQDYYSTVEFGDDKQEEEEEEDDDPTYSTAGPLYATCTPHRSFPV